MAILHFDAPRRAPVYQFGAPNRTLPYDHLPHTVRDYNGERGDMIPYQSAPTVVIPDGTDWRAHWGVYSILLHVIRDWRDHHWNDPPEPYRSKAAMRTDPVLKDQSKYRDADGTLRYSADGSEVFPGATGVRRSGLPCGRVSCSLADRCGGCA